MALTRFRNYQLKDFDYKESCRVATTANVTLSAGAPNTVDGISLAAGDRVLVKNQTTGSENGIYYVSTLGTGANGTWTRSADANQTTGSLTSGATIYVSEGSTQQGTLWRLITKDPITIGTTSQTWSQGGTAAGGSNTQVQFNNVGALNGSANLTWDGTYLSALQFKSLSPGGDEGGQIDFVKAVTNTTLTTGVSLDLYRDLIRIFETGGTNRGFYIDMTRGGASVGTDLLATNVNGNSNVQVYANANVAISSAGNANILVVTGTGANIAGTGNITGATALGSTLTVVTNVTTPQFISNVATGTAPLVVTSTTQVANLNVATAGTATTAGTVTTAAQPNITSLGTLTSLSITQAAITAAAPVLNVNTTWNNVSVTFTGMLTNITDTASAAASLIQDLQVGGSSKFNVRKDGNVAAAGTITGTQLISNIATGTAPLIVTSTTQVANLNVAVAGTAGTVTTAAQPNITSFGNVTTANIGTIQSSAANGNVTIQPNGTGLAVVTANFVPNANATLTCGSTTLRWANIFGLASSAQYADLAEKYLADTDYPVGTVLMIGGSAEVTIATVGETGIVGTVSEKPGFIMNDSLTGDHVVDVAYIGRVPCRVLGKIRRGDLLVVGAEPGVAVALGDDTFKPGCFVGKALQEYNSTTEGKIEILVGRL